ncbi:MAG: cysteine desulfurase [Bacteroidetes bacterium]|nr:cysteine desulfurase [Bacteroidota bacterium]
MTENIQKIRQDFPILGRNINNHPLVYFDNAATTHKPRQVLDALVHFYSHENSNIHRGVHTLAQEVTGKYENAREKIRSFINASYSHEIIFTKGTTESINLAASSFSKRFVSSGDEIVITEMEHHSNFIPWQIACSERSATLKVCRITDSGELDLDHFRELLTSKVKLIAVTHISNSLGTVNPVKKIIEEAHASGIPVLIDGAQAIAHSRVNVQELDCDFYCFSGHKMYGPTGIGILYGKEKYLNDMPPYQSGGSMIKKVTVKETTFGDLPLKFEAGTPPVGDAIALVAAVEYIENLGFDFIVNRENELVNYALDKLETLSDIKMYGHAKHRAPVISFLIDTIHPYDTGIILDKLGIAVRTGHHCTQPVMDKYNIPGTVRVSFAFYNTIEEIDAFIIGIERVKKILKV